MDNVMLGAGLACLIAAVIGGGLKAFGIEIPVLKSLGRQLALGILGFALVATASRSPLSVPRDREGTAVPEDRRGSAVQVAEPGKQHQTGPLSISVNNDPRIVPPGGSTAISVLATGSDGNPVADVQVTIGAGGGVFETTGALKVVGRTDDQGVFHTKWRTYDANAYTGDMSYVLDIKAAKDGMSDANGRTEIFVRK